MRRSVIGLVCSLVACLSFASSEPTASERGRQVVESYTTSDDGFASSISLMHMTIRDQHGRETNRQLEMRTLEGQDAEGDRSVTRFLSPPDIAGTTLLSHSHVEREDQQWLFLPSLRRVKRISSANKSGPFVGSEFAYEDLTGQELNKFDYEWLRTETLGELTYDVVRRTPRYKRSGYSHQLLWVDREISQVRKIEFYNRGERHSKTLHLTAFERHQSRYYRPHQLHMVNHLNGRETLLVVQEFTFHAGLTVRDFEHTDFAAR